MRCNHSCHEGQNLSNECLSIPCYSFWCFQVKIGDANRACFD